jgi:hypothetical protein
MDFAFSEESGVTGVAIDRTEDFIVEILIST